MAVTYMKIQKWRQLNKITTMKYDIVMIPEGKITTTKVGDDITTLYARNKTLENVHVFTDEELKERDRSLKDRIAELELRLSYIGG